MKTLMSTFVLTTTILSLAFAVAPTANAQLFGPIPDLFEDGGGLGPLPDFLDDGGFGPVPDYFGPSVLGDRRLGDAFSGGSTFNAAPDYQIGPGRFFYQGTMPTP